MFFQSTESMKWTFYSDQNLKSLKLYLWEQRVTEDAKGYSEYLKNAKSEYIEWQYKFLCPYHKMAREHLVFALSIIPSFRPIKVCLLNFSYILAWIWMKLGTDVVPQV